MGLDALIFVLFKKYLRDKKGVYLIIGAGLLVLVLFGWFLSFLYTSHVVNARMTIGEYVAYTNYISYTRILLPIVVYCIIKGIIKRTRVFPLIPMLAIPIVVSFVCSLVESSVRSSIIDGLIAGSVNLSLQILFIIVQLMNAIVAGFCAVSWIEYIDITPDESRPKIKESYSQNGNGKNTYSYLDEYKKKMKDGD